MKDVSTATQTTKTSTPKLISTGITTVLAVGGIVLATQQAQALSPLAIVNGITSSGGVGVSKNILYGDEPLQDLDVYYPKSLTKAMKAESTITGSYPMVVFVHGGSWENGNKDQYAFVGQSLAQAGYVTAVINYRKAPEHVYPDYVEDAAQAIAWSIDNATSLHADPKRLAVVGHSSGAFNAVAAVANEDFLAPYGIKPTDIATVIGIAGPYSYDFRKFDSSTAFAADATPDDVMPDRQIKGEQPPYLLLTAEKDKIVHVTNTIKMTQALKDAGVSVETGDIEGASHATSIGAMAPPLRWINDVRAQVLAYLDKAL
ncbi:alpha/beta hydrolase [Psychrobacter sp. AOP22-C1-22]|uniref:alpha/beta hydrolase n=1 Tax=unclassified Psychrobacter TaxID=196806 RepID=UPI0017882755|nr:MULTISPECIES: alpha/beta hydrolase [unclassified Psychrobacter]MBE0406620.1 alpha/beta hydrolase [Psychrobacter sp. FME6]MBE0446054.1 alpha/beta hydrolase [Psychrobacter sp. FME5]MDN5801814.1 alpha/beta hydrolase [Psychrobacter sp.]